MPADHGAPGWPVEPAPTAWAFGVGGAEPGTDLVAAGADLEPGTLLAAYRRGLFPMGLGRRGARPIGWWSPDPRGVLLLPDGLHVSRSLHRSIRQYRVSVDTAFTRVVAGCAAPGREGRWITPAIARAYERLHELGWAHSIEVWSGEQLAGGLYGVAIGGLFAGESMYSARRDASKVAVAALVERMRQGPTAEVTRRIIDVQWRTDHLATLGIVEIPRSQYLERLERALALPLPDAFSGSAARSPEGPRHADPGGVHPAG